MTTTLTSSPFVRSDAFRARSVPFRRLVDEAVFTLTDELASLTQPYVAFSGGKDSLVALHLAGSVRPGIAAIWCDDELEYDGLNGYIRATCDQAGVRLTVAAGWAEHGGWFRPWVDAPFWRAPSPDMAPTGSRIEEWVPAQGYDGCVRGVRTEEARHRRLNTATRGLAYTTAIGTRTIDPIARWTIDDVWAYLADRGLEPFGVYDTLTRAHVPRREQRVGPLPLTPRHILAMVDPTLPSRLEARYGLHW